jgi:16S rRNA (adenine1518-N6/adenine1519-N6)-dimethyltransferase
MISGAEELPRMNVPQLLREAGLRPQKSLGQNFLVEEGDLAAIVREAEVGPRDVVLEVGAGVGNLTRHLAAAGARVIAVEVDHRLVPLLEGALAGRANVEVLAADILRLDLQKLLAPYAGARYLVVANLPYYITAAVIAHLLEAEPRPDRMVLTVQLEVAERICAGPGHMSLLAVSVQYFGSPRIVGRIPAASFYPAPEVDSAIVRIDMKTESVASKDARRWFFRVVKAGFSQRRKQLHNALAAGLVLPREAILPALAAAGVKPARRAETLSLQEWHAVADALHPD